MAREIKDELLAPDDAAPINEAGIPPRIGEELPQPMPEESIQLELDEAHQKLAVSIILEDFASAEAARTERKYGQTSKGEQLDFDKWRKELLDLYFGYRLPKTIPWQYCSNRSMMIAQSILETLHARLFPAVYTEELTHWRPEKAIDILKTERVTKLMTWWIRVHVKMREFFDRWVRTIVGMGGALTETTWQIDFIDKGETSPESQQMNPDGTVSIIPEEKVIERREYTRSDIIPIEDVFLQKGATSIQKDPVIIRTSYLYRELEEMERNGQAVNVTTPSGADIKTLKDVLLVPGMPTEGATDEDELERIKDVKRRNIPVVCLRWYGSADIDGDGHSEQLRLMVFPEHRIYLGGVQIKDLSTRGRRHLDLTMYMPRLDEPHGLFGMGVLEQVKELAQEIDAIFNQMTDAHTMAVLRPFAYRPSSDLQAGLVTLGPNKGIPVENPQTDLFIPDFRIATDQLLNASQMVLAFIERLTAANAFIFGKQDELAGGSGTATRTNAIVGAAQQRFSVPAERLREGAARIVTQHLDLVQKNIPPDMEQRVLGQKGDPIFQEGELSEQGISGEFEAYLLPDESLGSKEAERTLMQQLYALLTGNILVATDPGKLYKVTADVLKAFGKDPEEYLGPAPDISALANPEDENTWILQGDFGQVQVNVMQNHLEHLVSHAKIQQSPVFQTLPVPAQAQVMTFVQEHNQQHMAFMQMLMAQSQVTQKQGGLQGGPNGRGGQAGKSRGTPPVGPEPGVGSVQNPLAQARAVQGAGESLATP